MPITAGDVLLKLGLDTVDFQKEVGEVKTTTAKSFSDFAKDLKPTGVALAAFGASITALGTMAVMQFTEMGSQIDKLTITTGMSAKSLSEFKYIAEQSGTSLEALTSTVRIMQQGIANTSDNTSEMGKAFQELGVDLNSLKAMKPEDQFNTLLTAIAGIQDPTERAAAATRLFGRSGTELLPMMKDGAAGLEAMKARAAELGIVFSAEAASAANDFGGAVTDLTSSVTGLQNEIGQALIPVLKPLIVEITNAIAGVTKWAKENPELAKWIAIIGGAVGVLATAIGGLILLLPTIIAGATALGGAFTVMLGPVGLVIAAIGLLVAAGVLLYQNWDDVSRFCRDIWLGIRTFLLEQVDKMLAGLQALFGWLPGIGPIIATARDQIRTMIDSNAVEREENLVKDSLQAVADKADETATEVGTITTAVNGVAPATKTMSQAASDEFNRVAVAAALASEEVIRLQNATLNNALAERQTKGVDWSTSNLKTVLPFLYASAMNDPELLAQYEQALKEGRYAGLSNAQNELIKKYEIGGKKGNTDWAKLASDLGITITESGGEGSHQIVTFNAAPKMASGGLIREPVLMTSLRTGQPAGIAGEAGIEAIVPLNRGTEAGYRSASIYIQMDGRTIAKLIGQPLLDEIRLRTGIQY